jgi:hypothetical protein
MRQVKTHTLNGTIFEIDLANIGAMDGICDYPRSTRPAIHIGPNINTKNGLETLLHECLHIENWAQTEEVVDRAAKEIANLLWRLGYRLRK